MQKWLIAASAAALIGLAAPAMAQSGHGRHGAGMLMQADADHDGAVTRAEFDAARAAMFARLDADADGALAREEMRGPHGHHRGPRGAGMRGVDANNDGAISREEFLSRPMAHFDRLDANKDGVISADERPQRHARAEGERSGGERGERRGRTGLDADQDGRITQAEFVAAGGAMFSRVDADGDGRITQAEAEAARPHRRGDN